MSLAKRIRLRRIRAGILFLGLLVLFAVQIVAIRREPRVVKVGDMKPFMNFSTVRVVGTLERDARRLRNASVFFLVNDGSGLLPVFQDGTSNETALAGNRIVVDGVLSVGVNADARLQVSSPADVHIEPMRVFHSSSNGVRLADVSAGQPDETITVTGRVAKVWMPEAGSRAPSRITLVDESGMLEVVHWLDSPPPVEVGDVLEARGVVSVYRGRLQLKIRQAGHIRAIGSMSRD